MKTSPRESQGLGVLIAHHEHHKRLKQVHRHYDARAISGEVGDAAKGLWHAILRALHLEKK